MYARYTQRKASDRTPCCIQDTIQILWWAQDTVSVTIPHTSAFYLGDYTVLGKP